MDEVLTLTNEIPKFDSHFIIEESSSESYYWCPCFTKSLIGSSRSFYFNLVNFHSHPFYHLLPATSSNSNSFVLCLNYSWFHSKIHCQLQQMRHCMWLVPYLCLIFYHYLTLDYCLQMHSLWTIYWTNLK